MPPNFEDLARPGVGYNGVMHEPCTQWQMLGNGYRVYSPALQRFRSADSLSPFADGGINAYTYCVSDPINHQDPTGHRALPILVTLMAAGALAVGAGAVASKIAGNDEQAKLLGAVAGLLAAGPGAMALRSLLNRYRGASVGQLRVFRRKDKDVVLAHGLPNRTLVGKAELDGSELAAVLRSKGVGDKPIKLVSCHSADWPGAQGQVVANATGQPVTGYVGKVRFNPLAGKVMWGSRITFHPQSDMQRAATAIRNHAMNRGDRALWAAFLKSSGRAYRPVPGRSSSSGGLP